MDSTAERIVFGIFGTFFALIGIHFMCRWTESAGKKKLRRLVNGFPGPNPVLPLVGNSLLLALDPKGTLTLIVQLGREFNWN
jgi:hypothetical protein